MNRPLNRGISRYLASTKPRLLVKDMGGVIVIGKASTISKQLADLANHNTLGQAPMQDVFADEDGYVPGISAFVMRGK